MRVSRTFPIDLAVGQIDMYRWVTEMTPQDYASFAPAHKAMGSFFQRDRFFMVNVECIGTDLVVQRYELIDHSPAHVTFYSPRTTGYIYRWFPVSLGVPWEMTVRPTSDRTCELVCTVGADFPSTWLHVVAWANGLGFHFIKRHLGVEGPAFAKDIERKFSSRPEREPSAASRPQRREGGDEARLRQSGAVTHSLS